MAVSVPAARARRPLNLLEHHLLSCRFEDVPGLVPGVALAAVLVVVSVWLADLINRSLGVKGLISYITMAIVIGLLVVNTVGVPAVCRPGVRFCLAKVLRLGIILMGIRLSIFDAAKIGAWGLPIVIVCIAVALVLTTYITRWLHLPDRLGTLIAVGTGICGNSAIVATAPGIEAKDEEVTYAVATITLFGILTMFVYPYLAYLLFSGNPTMAGLFEGTSIHDTSQVTAAGLIYDQTFGVTSKPSAADVAVVTKLVRNTAMALVIPLMVILYARRMTGQPGFKGQRVSAWKLFPIFVLGFILVGIIRSVGDAGLQGGGLAFSLWDGRVWATLTQDVATWSTYILATAMAGVGLGTSFASLKGIGLKPFLAGLLSAASVGVVSAILVWLLGPQVRL